MCEVHPVRVGDRCVSCMQSVDGASTRPEAASEKNVPLSPSQRDALLADLPADVRNSCVAAKAALDDKEVRQGSCPACVPFENKLLFPRSHRILKSCERRNLLFLLCPSALSESFTKIHTWCVRRAVVIMALPPGLVHVYTM